MLLVIMHIAWELCPARLSLQHNLLLSSGIWCRHPFIKSHDCSMGSSDLSELQIYFAVLRCLQLVIRGIWHSLLNCVNLSCMIESEH